MQATRTRVSVLVSLAFILANMASTAHAALTHYVPFDQGYVEGDLNGQGGSDLGFGQNTWFDGAPAETGSAVVTGSLSPQADLVTNGNSARTAPADFNLAFYSFDQDSDGANGEIGEDNLGTGEHWLSFVARADQGAFFAGLSLVKFFGPEILYIGKVSSTGSDRDNDGDVDGNDLLIIQRDNPLDPADLAQWELDYGLTNTTAWGVDPQDGQGQRAIPGSDATVDTLIVAKINIGPNANDDFIELFLDPVIESGTPPGASDLTVQFNEDVLDNRAIDEIRLGGQNGAFYVDEIRIGTSWNDVTPSLLPNDITSVPEPSTSLLLIGLATIAVYCRRQ